MKKFYLIIGILAMAMSLSMCTGCTMRSVTEKHKQVIVEKDPTGKVQKITVLEEITQTINEEKINFKWINE